MPRARGTGRPIRQRNKWRIRWLDETGRRRSAVFDTYNDAVKALRANEVATQEVLDGARRPPPRERTFGDLCDLWLERRAKRKRSAKDDRSIIRRHLRPRLGATQLASLVENTDPIEDMTDELLDTRSDKTVHNILTLLVSMLRYAEEKGWVLRVPRIRKPKIVLLDADYRWLRTDDEIQRFLNAAQGEGEHVHALYATAVFTGLRAGELAALQWDDVSFDRRLITVQRSFGGPTKSKDVRYVPILDRLLPILRAWRLRCSGALVFPNERGGMHCDSSARIFQEVLHRVLRGAGFSKIRRRHRGDREDWYVTFHGLRHTFASHWTLRGGNLHKLQKILGHKSPQMTQRYAHLAPDAFAEDYALLGAADPPGPVVPLTPASVQNTDPSGRAPPAPPPVPYRRGPAR